MNRYNNYKNKVDGLGEIKLLNDIEVLNGNKKNVTVIIAIFNREVNIKNLIVTLKDMGYTDIITFCEFIEIYKESYEDTFYLNCKDDFIKNLDQIKEIKDLLADDKSTKIYDSIVRFRITKNYFDLIESDRTEELYFPNDISNYYYEEKIRFIDCGAYNGDTVEALCNKFKNIEAIAAFEPDLTNFNTMMANYKAKKFSESIDNFIALPMGVYMDSRQLKFNMSSSEASSISENGIDMIQCTSIDESMRDFRPTHIKMDIEGSEYCGLLGAKETIIKEKPNLAISLYHKSDDLYTIPKLIDSWKLGYKFYLRLYGYSGFDLVLYAVADK